MLQGNVRQPIHDTADVTIVDDASIGERDVEVSSIDADRVFPFRGGRQHLGRDQLKRMQPTRTQTLVGPKS